MTTNYFEAVQAANRAFQAGFSQADTAALAALYTRDAQVLPPGAKPIIGHNAIAQFWASIINMGIQQAKLDSLEVEGHSDTAIELGQYTLFADGSKLLDQGKYIVIWKLEAAQWKIHRDIWNTSLSSQK